MKKMMLIIAMLAMAAPAFCSEWSDKFRELTPEEMKDVTCRNGGFTNLGFEVITSMYGSQRETIVRPAEPELNPPNYVFERMVITEDSKYAGMIPVGTEVAYQYIGSATYESGPSELRDAAGISSFGGVKMIVKDSVIISWAR